MRKLHLVLVLAAAAVLAPRVSRADVIAPDQPVAGFSQGELTERWWQWALSHPTGANPIEDTTGEFAHFGDQGSVFFLAGAFSQDPVTRSATVRSDQTLFLPFTTLISVIPLFGDTEAEIREDAANDLGVVSELSLTLDGAPVPLPASAPSLSDYHQPSPPGLFDAVFPANNIYGLDPTTLQAVQDGYWAALDPLAPGEHQLHFTSLSVGTGPYEGDAFRQDITYNLTSVAEGVVPEPVSALLLAPLAGAILIRRRPAAL